MAREVFENAVPVIREEGEQTWENNVQVSLQYDLSLSLDWGSNVPGSGAPEKSMVAAVQALENRGYTVSGAGYEYLQKGLEAFDRKDFAALHQYSALLRRELARAVKDDTSKYWSYQYYQGFDVRGGSAVPSPGAGGFDVRGETVRGIVKTSIGLIPADSEYRSVIDFAWECCEKFDDWHDALSACEERYKKYNWIHCYPNACCLVIALYYGNGDFTETLHIITMCGLDADCNAGVIMPIIGISQGMSAIPERYMHPAFDKLTTYLCGAN